MYATVEVRRHSGERGGYKVAVTFFTEVLRGRRKANVTNELSTRVIDVYGSLHSSETAAEAAAEEARTALGVLGIEIRNEAQRFAA